MASLRELFFCYGFIVGLVGCSRTAPSFKLDADDSAYNSKGGNSSLRTNISNHPRCTQQEQDALLRFERAKGVIWGLAAGDENGGPAELVGQLAESIQSTKPWYDGVDVANRYLKWYKDPQNEAVIWDVGKTASKIFPFTNNGFEVPKLAEKLSASQQPLGVGGTHRVAPIAAANWLDVDQIQQAAWEETGLTHPSDLARGTSIAMVLLCRHLILGKSWTEALSFVLMAPKLQSPKMKKLRTTILVSMALAQATEKAASGDEANLLVRENVVNTSLALLDNGGHCVYTFRAALHFAILATDTTANDALLKSKEFAGVDNYCPVLVGALIGARFGASKLTRINATVSHTPAQYEILLANIESSANTLGASWCNA